MGKCNRAFAALILAAIGPAAGGTSWAAGAGREVLHLQREIGRASEQGNYAYAQTLRRELAERYAAAGGYALAARQYELLLASRPPRRERVQLFTQLGKMRNALQDYGGAIQAYGDALHDDPSAWEPNLFLARAYARIDLNTQALEAYQRCLRIKPKAPEAYEENAEVYERLGFLSRAIDNYQKALSLAPMPQSYLGLADCYGRLGDLAHAAEILRKAKAVLPRADYDIRLGEIYQKQGDLSRACAAWEEALRADPHRGDVALNLALAYEDRGRRAESERLLNRLQSAYPGSPLVHFLRAWIDYERGERPAARREALAAQALNPTDVVRHYNERLLALLETR